MATVTPKIETKTITTRTGFEIHLTNEEAYTLYLILRSVGGDLMILLADIFQIYMTH